jgi:hypothetical protein
MEYRCLGSPADFKEKAVKLKVDTTGVLFMLVTDPEPVTDFKTNEPKIEGGKAVYQLRLVVMDDGEADVILVKVAGQPSGLVPGSQVQVERLTAQPWSMGDRAGIAYRADKITGATGSGSRSAA